MKKRKGSIRSLAIKKGFRSGLEDTVAEQLTKLNIEFEYEDKTNKIKYTKPATNHTYLPDFRLPNGIIVESKGRFVLDDQKKHLLIKEQHPELDIRFVFSNSNTKLRKGSKTTYADWCIKHGIKYADKLIPESWIKESVA